ncbi:IclR family transcriptional regulator [Pantoea coffeiphila]|uniref:IclR family transcriptional regulator n=1 Tax=Pantoea coffeiphila TaxID=1465635 RepID=UPI001961B125|nr:IclR family transcriptional regulator [Pantoea coffeiphila]MBM7344946.1 DNA-binding IclR family transcriptional regulator [Pantoea coffeiphila]
MSGNSGTKSDQPLKSVDSVPALRRAVTILDLVAAASGSLSAADITRQLALPKSTAHGQINVLTELGLLVRTAEGTYRLGPHLMHWADSFLSQMDFVSLFRDYFAADSELDGYTITLTVLDRDEVVYVSCRNTDQPLGHSFRIGKRLPAPFTATGKVLLSELEYDELERIFADRFPAPLTASSVSNLAELQAEFPGIRERGFSIDNGQIHEAMTCVGSAIYDHTGKVVAGIATSFLSSEARSDMTTRLGEKIRHAAMALSQQSGYRGK